MAQNGAQGSIWEAPAEHLAHCGGVWGPWWSILGALVRHLGSFRVLWGTFLEPCERHWGPSWAIRAHLGGLWVDFGGFGGRLGGLGGPFGLILGALGVIFRAFGATF